MTIPEIRKRLLELAIELEQPELNLLADETRRRPYVRKARAASVPVTDKLRKAIKSYSEVFPDASYQEIGEVFKVNAGRVSEVLAGFRI